MSIDYTKERLTRTEKLQADADETMHTICAHVAQGGSLITLCETWKVIYGHMFAWIASNKDRNRMYVDAQNARVEWSREAILVELRKIGMFDMRMVFDEDGEVLNPKDWPKEVASVVQHIDIIERFDKEGGLAGKTYKVKLWNKEKALELLGKNLSMFIDQVNHSGNLTLEDIVAGSRKKKTDER